MKRTFESVETNEVNDNAPCGMGDQRPPRACRRPLRGRTGRWLPLAALTALLWMGWAPEIRAQADVRQGEVSGFFVIPFSDVPGDPRVMVIADLLFEGRVILSPSGAAHLMASEVKGILWSRVAGENYRYELLDLQMRTTNTDNLRGQMAASAHLAVKLLRIDPATSLPDAVLTGEGHLHISANLEREWGTRVERVNWTVSPLP